jgi:hypothetical protein
MLMARMKQMDGERWFHTKRFLVWFSGLLLGMFTRLVIENFFIMDIV